VERIEFDVESLKQEFDAKPWEQLLEITRHRIGKTEEDEYSLYRVLFYIDRSGRFRDDRRYKDKTFTDWLRAECWMTMNEYRLHARAYGVYFEAVKQFGIKPVLYVLNKGLHNDRIDQIFKEAKTPDDIRQCADQTSSLVSKKTMRMSRQLIKRNVTADNVRAMEVKLAKEQADKSAAMQLANESEQRIVKLVQTVYKRDEAISKKETAMEKLQRENKNLKKDLSAAHSKIAMLQKENDQLREALKRARAAVSDEAIIGGGCGGGCAAGGVGCVNGEMCGEPLTQ